MPGIPDSEWNNVRALKENGAPLREIAEKYGTSVTTAHKFVRKHTEESLADRATREVAFAERERTQARSPVSAKAAEDKTREAVRAALGDFKMRDVAQILVDGLAILLSPNEGSKVALNTLADRLIYASAYLRLNQQ